MKGIVKKMESGCFSMDIENNHGQWICNLPERNWYTHKDLREMMSISGITCFDLTRLSEHDKKVIGVIP